MSESRMTKERKELLLGMPQPFCHEAYAEILSLEAERDKLVEENLLFRESNIDLIAREAQSTTLACELAQLVNQAGAVCLLFEQAGGYRLSHPDGSSVELKGLADLIVAIREAMAKPEVAALFAEEKK